MFNKKVKTISADELMKLNEEKVKIIDVREPHEYQEGHIPGAENLPLSQVESFKGEGPVYVICRSGRRSEAAAEKLEQMNISAINVTGGMLAWKGEVEK